MQSNAISDLQVIFPSAKGKDLSPVFARNEVFIPAPPVKVWNCLIRAAQWPKWYGNAKNIDIEGGGTDLALGTKFHWNTFGVRVHTVIEEFIPNQRLSWSGRGLGSTAYHGWVIRECEGGCIVVTEETQQGFIASIARAYLRAGLLKWHQRWLEGLSRVAQASGEQQ